LPACLPACLPAFLPACLPKLILWSDGLKVVYFVVEGDYGK
jgi:hypothetical protein